MQQSINTPAQSPVSLAHANSQAGGEDGSYRLMDFLHLADTIDLELLASALRPLVGADFEFRKDQFVECMVARWDGHEVIVAHPLEDSLAEYACGGELTENNAATCVTLAVRRALDDSRDVGHWQPDHAASIATRLAATFDTEVLHSKTWNIDHAKTTFWNRCYRNQTPAIPDKRRPFPLMRGLTVEMVATIQPTCTVLGPIEVPIDGRLPRGELVSIPYAPEEMFAGLSAARDALIGVLDYAEHRQASFVSLGALIPSISRQGRLLKQARPAMAITTGHGFTAVTIAQMVEDIEKEIGSGGVVAVMGAAGSTGRAALRCMFRRCPEHRVLAVDLPQHLTDCLSRWRIPW